ncbi:hypothetical protein BQ8482_100255 [Mesorhizobium delmotii]|uniref:Uncharacterized protein n=1 Tax=Mesorhizobium delmotii TaxID=1631247 RepID=A0A2P9AAB6_9HYPH|nr:hypothetical protein BQ8482_100255 [Mesorhizobium delmotii]
MRYPFRRDPYFGTSEAASARLGIIRFDQPLKRTLFKSALQICDRLRAEAFYGRAPCHGRPCRLLSSCCRRYRAAECHRTRGRRLWNFVKRL